MTNLRERQRNRWSNFTFGKPFQEQGTWKNSRKSSRKETEGQNFHGSQKISQCLNICSEQNGHVAAVLNIQPVLQYVNPCATQETRDGADGAFFKKMFFMFERERASGGGQRERRNGIQSRLCAGIMEHVQGSNSGTSEIMPWAEIWLLTEPPRHPTDGAFYPDEIRRVPVRAFLRTEDNGLCSQPARYLDRPDGLEDLRTRKKMRVCPLLLTLQVSIYMGTWAQDRLLLWFQLWCSQEGSPLWITVPSRL